MEINDFIAFLPAFFLLQNVKIVVKWVEKFDCNLKNEFMACNFALQSCDMHILRESSDKIQFAMIWRIKMHEETQKIYLFSSHRRLFVFEIQRKITKSESTRSRFKIFISSFFWVRLYQIIYFNSLNNLRSDQRPHYSLKCETFSLGFCVFL